MKNLFLLLSSITVPILLNACDICGCYTPPLEAADHEQTWYASISEQFTRFGSIRVDGHEVDDPIGQYLNSSITQLILGRSFLGHRFYLQANLPLIYREYKRPVGFDNEHGDESGLGDASILGRWQVYELAPRSPLTLPKNIDGKNLLPLLAEPRDLAISFNLLAGIKLPTGDSSRIKEEFEEVEIEGAPESGIHGHDLALGTGSYDALFGGELMVRYQSFFFQAETRFTLRGDGRHSYHFANDLTWNGGPGWYVSRSTAQTITVQAVISGETKDTDRFQGREAVDTGITALYLGPQLAFSSGRISAEIGLDLPVLLNNTALQAVPDYRVRAALTIHF